MSPIPTSSQEVAGCLRERHGLKPTFSELERLICFNDMAL